MVFSAYRGNVVQVSAASITDQNAQLQMAEPGAGHIGKSVDGLAERHMAADSPTAVPPAVEGACVRNE